MKVLTVRAAAIPPAERETVRAASRLQTLNLYNSIIYLILFLTRSNADIGYLANIVSRYFNGGYG